MSVPPVPANAGRVTLEKSAETLPGVAVTPPLPTLVPEGPGARPARLPLAPTAGGGLHYTERGFTADIAANGSITFDDRSNIQLADQALVRFDLTEALAAMVGNDPFVTEKLRFFEASRPLREKMCDRARAEELRNSLFDLSRRLRAIWAQTDLPARQRRSLLFELWDDCGEGGEGKAAEVALMARVTVLAFINHHLPPGSADAYDPEELVALNEQRQSTSPFLPYEPVAQANGP